MTMTYQMTNASCTRHADTHRADVDFRKEEVGKNRESGDLSPSGVQGRSPASKGLDSGSQHKLKYFYGNILPYFSHSRQSKSARCQRRLWKSRPY